MTRGRVENYEPPIRAADGQTVWISISLSTFPSEGLAEGVMVDITEKRAAAEQIREQAELLDKTADAIFVLEKGQFTEPIVVPEGTFILFVEDRKHAGNIPLNEVREQIERMLVSQNARQARERWLERLRRNAYIKHF